MKLNIIVAICIGLLTYGVTIYLDSANAPKRTIIETPVSTDTIEIKQKIPAFSFTDIDGKAHNIRDFDGKVVLLNFWASWCPPCVKEFPDLLKIAKEYDDKIVLIALSSDHDPAAMHRFLNKVKKTNTINTNVFVALDEDTKITRDLFGTFRLPETFVIDRTQHLHKKLIGTNWTMNELQSLLNTL